MYYYDLLSESHFTAVILDPRLNIHYFRQQKRPVSEDTDFNNKYNVEWIIDTFKNAFEMGKYTKVQSETTKNKIGSHKKTEETRINNAQLLLQSIIKKSGQNIQDEIKEYMKIPQLDPTDDPLTFWKFKQKQLPQMAKMARDYLSIQGSSVASESTFSLGRRIVTDHRGSLNAQTIQALVCLNSWLKKEAK